jgi:chromosome segregation ATPase
MVITLDNRQTVTIFEQGNLLKQIEPYIDKEIYDLLEDKFNGVDELAYQNETLDEKLSDADQYIEELLEKYDRLEIDYDDLYEENKELESQKDKILHEVNDLADELDEDNFKEIANKLKELYWNN